MKKFLSLVLALVMAMSLVTVSAGAKEFKDMADAEQAYKEAIDVISDLGIVGGVTADTFQPDGKLTRGGATKFVANLMLGPDLAAKLPDGAPFTDVPAGSTFAKYANYLKSKGVIGGYGNGSYGVKNDLSGDAFLKMVLGALGYDASSEGYTGDGWQVNVAIDAINAGLTKGLPADLDTSKVITREIAAQIVLNALEADTVYYDTKGTISIGNVVSSNNSEVKPVAAADNAVDYAGDANDDKVQLVEKLFPGVTKSEEATDDFMRPATEWFDKEGKSMVLAVDAPVKTYAVNTSSKTTEGKDIYADLKLTKKTAYTLYTDGVQTAQSYVNKDNTTDTFDTAQIGQHGATLEAYKDGENVVLVQINEYIAKVEKVNAASGSTKRSVQLSALTGLALPTGITTSTKFTTDSFAKGDVVTYTISKKGTTAIKSMELAAAKTGELTQTAGSTIYVDGAAINVYVPYNRNWSASSLTFGKAVKAYLNSNGHYIYVEMVDDSTKLDKYAYVLAAKTETSEADWATGKVADPVYKAQLLFVDGTTEIVEVKASAADLVNDFVKYGVNAKGQYELTDATTGNITANAAVAITKGEVKATVNGANTARLNNATTFIVKTEKTVGEETQAVYTVYVGYKAVPTLTGTTKSDLIVKTGATAASYVYVDATADGFTVNNGTSASDMLVLAAGYSNGKLTGTKYSDANGSWYTMKGLVNGEIKSIKVEAVSADKVNGGFYNYITDYTINEYGQYVIGNRVGTADTYSASNNIGVDYEDGLVILNTNANASNKNNAKSLAEDATIVYIASTTDIKLWTAEDLDAYKDTAKNDKYYGFYAEGSTTELQYLFIVKAAD